MFVLKQVPEDFIVREIPKKEFLAENALVLNDVFFSSALSENVLLAENSENKKFTSGKYAIFFLQKRRYTTEDAIYKLCETLRIKRSDVGYAGIKDRLAITAQFISVLGGYPAQERQMTDLSWKFVCFSNKPLSLGDLEGNYFEITVRNLEESFDIEKFIVFSRQNSGKIVNYFDDQRFSKNNVALGRHILKKEYKAACDIIMSEDSMYGEQIRNKLEQMPHGYVNALSCIPEKILLIYVHAYQSFLWNESVRDFLIQKSNAEEKNVKDDFDELTFPVIGFSTETNNPMIDKILRDLMNREKISFRDFIVRDFKGLSFDGTSRKIFLKMENLEIGDLEQDDLNSGKKKLLLKFSLEKGSYATMAVKSLLSIIYS